MSEQGYTTRYTTTNACIKFNVFYSDLRWRPSSPLDRTYQAPIEIPQK
jgi:hypothetical protein